MKLVEKYSHLNGFEWINHHKPELWNEIEEVIDNMGGYYIIVKLDDGLKAGIDVFKINSIKYKISQNLKNSFDPKRILNPGKMYSGI